MNAATSVNVWGWTKNNELMTFSDWDPSSTSTGNCTAIQSSSLWAAVDCQMKYPFVCQLPTKISFCEDGWAHFNLTNSCFKKFSAVDWANQSTAEKFCIQQGSHLASIHSPEENQFVGKLTGIGYRTANIASIFWIGAQKNDNSNNWYWTDGTTFDYHNWNYILVPDFHCANFWPDWTLNFNNTPLQ